MSHTPGPWETKPCSNGGLIIVRGGGMHQHTQSHLQVLPVADALLMAAAPDLLEACKEAAAYLIAYGEEVDGSDGEIAKTFDLLRAAIAKAEGR